MKLKENGRRVCFLKIQGCGFREKQNKTIFQTVIYLTYVEMNSKMRKCRNEIEVNQASKIPTSFQ